MEGVDPTEDAVGRTSARLLAAGVPSRERLDALHLLAVLDASADATGRIRRPLDDLAAEFELAPAVVLRALDHLEAAGALVRDGANVVLPRHGQGAVGGMLLADFLADVRSALDEADRPPARQAFFARASVGLVAAAAIIAIALVVPGGGGPTTSVAASSTTVPAVTERTVASDVPPPTSLPHVATSVAPSPSPHDASPSPSAVDATTTDSTVPPPVCPTGAPTATVVAENTVDLGQTAATVGSEPTITGTATNASSAHLVITEMRVYAGGVAGRLAEPLAVPAGETITWSVTADRLNVLHPTEAVIDDWAWADPSHAGCPA